MNANEVLQNCPSILLCNRAPAILDAGLQLMAALGTSFFCLTFIVAHLEWFAHLADCLNFLVALYFWN